MITIVDSKNSEKKRLYDNFFANVSMLLRSHDPEGGEVPFGSSQAVLSEGFTPVENLTKEDYQPGVYYIRDGSGGYELAIENFAEGKEYFTAPTNDITSLDEFFEHIADIALINLNYTRLPLDEPLFEIDLNSRTIKIPTEFQKNGVGIQGDHLAESIYFSCPRFFDATDLGNESYLILIQWENAAGEQRISKPTIRDIESKPGYIIFDFPICDKITTKAGIIKMAIRFYRIDEDGGNVLYSLSTQPTSISIKSGLNFDNFEKYILNNDFDVHDDFQKRFVNSDPLNIKVPLEPPTIDDSKLPQYIYLTKDNPQQKVYISAEGEGILSYTWKRKQLQPRGYDEEHPHGYTDEEIRELYPLEDNPTAGDYGRAVGQKGGDFVPFNGGVVEIVPTEDENYIANKDYYIKTDRGMFIYVENKDQFDAFKRDNKEMLEKKTYATISDIGVYYVEVSNRKKSTTKTKTSREITVEYPKKPEFKGSKGFAWLNHESYPDNNSNVIGADPAVHSVSAIAPVQSDGKTIGELSYQWYRADLTNMNFSLTEEKPNTCFEKIDDGIREQYTISQPGYYRVLVTNSLNGQKDSITSGIIRATNKAKVPTLSIDDEDGFVYFGKSITVSIDENSIEPTSERISSDSEAKEFFGEDTITYKWYKYKGGDSLEADKVIAAAGNFTETVTKAEEMPEETSATFKPQGSGIFFCIVTNTYNGNKATASTPLISVISDNY